MPSFQGLDHLAITVTDLDASVPFYIAALGLDPVAEMRAEGLNRRIFSLPDGTTLGLTQHDEQLQEGGRFSPFGAGLDHVGFGVVDRAELRAWARHLEDAGIPTSGIVEAPYGAALSLKDPDGIALEFFVRGAGDGA